MAHGGRPLWMNTAFFLIRRHPNVFLDISGIPPKTLLKYFPRLEEIASKTLFGTDWPAAPADLQVQAILNLKIPKDLQEGWGYPPITDQDRANMLGINLAKLLNIDVPKKYKKWVK